MLRLAAGLVALLAGAGAMAQAYPTKPIRFMVAFAPGGGIDVMTRVIGAKMAEDLGQPVIAENRAASAGIVATEAVARAAPDGYTLLTGGSWMVVGSLLYKNLSYEPLRDFTPIALVADSAMQLMIHSSVPVNSVKELVEYSKANPGKLSYATSGVGHPFHLALELLKERTGADLTHVPYKGSAQAIPDLLAGRVHVLFSITNNALLGQVKAGKLRALATTGDKRMAEMPDVPTFEEIGIRNLRPAVNVGIVGPAGMQRPVVERINAALAKATSAPDVLQAYQKQNWMRMHSSAEEYGRIIKYEVDTWGPLIRSLKVQLDVQ